MWLKGFNALIQMNGTWKGVLCLTTRPQLLTYPIPYHIWFIPKCDLLKLFSKKYPNHSTQHFHSKNCTYFCFSFTTVLQHTCQLFMPGTSFSETFLFSKTWKISWCGSFLQTNCVCVPSDHVANYRISCYIGTFSCILKRAGDSSHSISIIVTICSSKKSLTERKNNFRHSGKCILDSCLYCMDISMHSLGKQLNNQIILPVGLKQH